MTRNPDDIMAEHLLTGGKMLSEMCPACGAPLFEIKGVKRCVVCEENAKNITATTKTGDAAVEVIVPRYARPQAAPADTAVTADLDALIRSFADRAKTEPDPARCLTLMECIRTAAEAKTILARSP